MRAELESSLFSPLGGCRSGLDCGDEGCKRSREEPYVEVAGGGASAFGRALMVVEECWREEGYVGGAKAR